MCGIIGLIVKDGYKFCHHVSDWVELCKETEKRGRDGFGYALNGEVYKSLGGVDEGKLFDVFQGMENGDVFISNSRAAPVTEGSVKVENVHPFKSKGGLALVHNGIITNDLELAQEYSIQYGEVDSEVIPNLIEKIGVKKTCESLVGGFSFAACNAEGDLIVGRNYKTLYQTNIGGAYVVCSERDFILNVFPNALVVEFPVDTVAIFRGGEVHTRAFNPKYKSYTPELDSNKAMVVISGGMDSSLVAYLAEKVFDKRVTLIHFNYAHKSLQMESIAVQKVMEKLDCDLVTVDLDWLGALGHSPLTDPNIPIPLGRESSKSSLAWVPARNLVMLSIAAAYAESMGIKWVLYGSNLEEEGPAWKDNDLAAVEAFDNALYFGTLKGVRISNVLGRLMKRDIVALGTYLGVPLDSTCSCDEPIYQYGNWFACGRCGACQNRRHAFIQAGIDDPQWYVYPLVEVYASIENTTNTDIENILSRVVKPIERSYRESVGNVYYSK